MIHVVGAQLPAHELLEQVVLFVGGFGRRKARQCIAAIALAQGGETLGDQGDGLLPAGGLQLAIFADKRGREALLALDKVKAEAPLDAEQPLIDWRVAVPLHIADAVARLIDIEGDAAADPAVSTDGIDRREQLGAPLRLVAGIHQGAGGADLYAGAALHAVGVAHREPRVELRAVREGAIAVLGKAQHPLHCLLTTGLHALAAADAAVGIEHDKFAAVIHCKLLALAGIEGALLDLVFGGIVAQCTIGVGLTATLEAAAGFVAGIGITQPALHLGKASLPLGNGQMRHDGAGDFFQVSKLGGIDLLERGSLAGVEWANRVDHVTVEELIDGQRGLAAIGDRLDSGGGPAAQIADGEQVAVAAVHGLWMGLQRLPAGEGEGEGLPFHKAEIRLLRHCRNHGIKLFKEELAGGLRAAATGGVRLAESHLLEAHLTDATTAVRQVFYRVGQHHEAHPFMLRLVDLVGFSGHLGAGAAIDEGGVSPQPDRCAGAVDSGITTPDHRHPLAGGEPLGQHPILEVIDPEITTGQGAAGVIHRYRLGSADGQTDRIIVAAQRREGDLVAQSLPGVDPHAALAHQVDLLIEDRLGQPVFGDPVAQPATRFGHRLEQVDLEPLVTQIVTAGEAARAAADNGHPLALGGLLCRLIGGNLGQIEIGGMALELTNGQRLIHQRAAALRFTKSGADPADGKRHRQGLFDDGHGRLVLPHGDVMQIGLNVHPGRTGALAGGFAIGVVIRKDAAERLLAVLVQDIALGRDHHPCLGGRLAGAPDAETGNLDHAEIAGCFGAAGVVTAQGGDIDLVLF